MSCPTPNARDKRREGCYGCRSDDPATCATNCPDAQSRPRDLSRPTVPDPGAREHGETGAHGDCGLPKCTDCLPICPGPAPVPDQGEVEPKYAPIRNYEVTRWSTHCEECGGEIDSGFESATAARVAWARMRAAEGRALCDQHWELTSPVRGAEHSNEEER